jgi:hypothetical protein
LGPRPRRHRRIWRGGCIIRARFLNRITEAYERDPGLTNLMLDPFFKDVLNEAQAQLARGRRPGHPRNGIPVPAFSASLGYYDSYRSERLPANLLQAQRDFFGAHTYERTDKPAGEWFPHRLADHSSRHREMLNKHLKADRQQLRGSGIPFDCLNFNHDRCILFAQASAVGWIVWHNPTSLMLRFMMDVWFGKKRWGTSEPP